jgi:hypothetical protein
MATPVANSRKPYSRIRVVWFSGTPEIFATNLGASNSASPSPTLNQASPFTRRFDVDDGFSSCECVETVDSVFVYLAELLGEPCRRAPVLFLVADIVHPLEEVVLIEGS